MKLKRLGNKLTPIQTNRVPMLEAKAGTTPRIRGRAWMAKRQRALVAGEFKCVDCGSISFTNEVDHDTPLEQGGSNDDTNLKIRCVDCHAAKTKTEAKGRSGKRW